MEKERLIFTINRFDHYFDSVNNKSNLVLGLSTFLVGGFIALYPFLLEKTNNTIWLHINLITVIALGLGAMLIIIFASRPYLPIHYNSVIYFESISKLSLARFKSISSQFTTEQDLEDLREQTHCLAVGLRNKFRRLNLACIFLGIQFLLFIPLIVIILTTLK